MRVDLIMTATFSEFRTHRYTLERIWDTSKQLVMFVGLNPSTADETANDPTITRCINFAKAWGYGGLVMTNLFAFRATDPKVMKLKSDPIGAENDKHLLECAARCALVIAAWGTHGAHLNRGEAVRKLISNLHVLRVTQGGFPSHPLYLPGDLKPIFWMSEP